MCLAVPAQLVSCEGTEAMADLHGNRIRINTMLLPEVRPGDWVLIHAGFAIQQLDQKSVEETWEILDELNVQYEGDGHEPADR